MASMHNTRILRFLIVLGTVILTIFIYASYSSNTSLAPPPHMRAAAGSSSPSSAALAFTYRGSQQQNKNTTTGNGTFFSAENASKLHSNNNNVNAIQSVIAKVNKKSAAASPSAVAASHNGFVSRKQHREPTIDVDAGGVGTGEAGVAAGDGANNIGNGLDDIPDDAALDRFVSNDLLEEQYGQNIDSILGNINNSVASATGVPQAQQNSQQQQQETHQQQQSQQKPQQLNQQQQQQKLQQNQLNDNNLNKILDSDVLIPTSNLQKFIENADKILKNITVLPSPSQAATMAAASKSNEKDTVVVKQPQPPPQPLNENDDVALPPSVVMTIKRGNAAVPAEPAVITTKSNPTPKIKTTPKPNATTAAVDPAQGIQTQRIYESGHMNEEINLDRLCPNEGVDLKLLILITSAQSHADARLAIRQTWGHYGIRRDVSTAFILGRTTNESLNLALTQENFIYGDLIRGHFIDSYNNLTLKTVSSLEWVDQHCARAKYVLKTDDDMFINVPKLLAFLDSHSKEKRVIFGRLAKKWKPIRNKKSKYYVSTGQFGAPVFPPFTTGPAYVMSHDIIHELYLRSLHQVYLKLEDVFTTGIVAQQLGIKRVHVNEFLNRRIAFNPCNIRKTISVHMIKANEQFDLWKKLLDQTTKCK